MHRSAADSMRSLPSTHTAAPSTQANAWPPPIGHKKECLAADATTCDSARQAAKVAVSGTVRFQDAVEQVNSASARVTEQLTTSADSFVDDNESTKLSRTYDDHYLEKKTERKTATMRRMGVVSLVTWRRTHRFLFTLAALCL